MNWTLSDFAFAVVLVASVVTLFTLAARRSRSVAYRAAVGLALAAAFVLVWVNGAVGIIGNEDNDANAMFYGVLGMAIAGSVIARGRPRGMARAMGATALTQVLVGVIALAADAGDGGALWPRDLLFATAFFAGLWLASAWLFHQAAQAETPAQAVRAN